MPHKMINVEDYQKLAKSTLPKVIYDYLEGGADDEKGLHHNRQVFDQWRFKPQRLVDISERDILKQGKQVRESSNKGDHQLALEVLENLIAQKRNME